MTDKPIPDDSYLSKCRVCKRKTVWRRSETWPQVYVCTGGCESTKIRQRARGPK